MRKGEEGGATQKDSKDQSQTAGEDSDEPKRFQGEADFMANVKPNTRNWSHKIRRDFNKFDRIDFTQTLLFNSAKELEFTKERTYTVRSDFALNDQVSTFRIKVNLFSSEGKYGFAYKDVVSSMPAYSKFTLPTSLVIGDQIDVPVNVVNNHRNSKNIEVKIKEYVFNP